MEKIEKFWKWFVENEVSLRDYFNSPSLIEELDLQVSKLGRVEWEIGPIDDKKHYLAISPSLNLDMIALTREIVEKSPVVKDWSFLAFKPKKDWVDSFNMRNEMGKAIKIQVSHWQFLLFKFEDGTLDVDVKFDRPIEGDQQTGKLAIEIALTNLLGEEMYMNFVGDVRVVDDFGSNIQYSRPFMEIADLFRKSVQH